LRKWDLEALLAVLDPDAVFRVDETTAPPGAPREIRGARNWAEGALAFSSVARFVQPAVVNGAVGLVWAPRGRLASAPQPRSPHGITSRMRFISILRARRCSPLR